MKRRIKSLLHRTGLLPIIEPLYFNLKSASFPVLAREIQIRAGNSPDRFPVPPGKDIYAVIACHWAALYLESGARIVEDMQALLVEAGYSLCQFVTVLDFGCGCGRLIRHIREETEAELFGSDYNSELIAWCGANLSFGKFNTNDLAPPMAYEDQQFDFIYSRSVFTHLPEALQTAWLEELYRVLAPGGVVYLTTHGNQLSRRLSEDEQHRFRSDQIVVTYTTVAGENLCSSYASAAAMQRLFEGKFRVVHFRPGSSDEHLQQDVYLLRKNV